MTSLTLKLLSLVFKGKAFRAENIDVVDTVSFAFTIACIKDNCERVYRRHQCGLVVSKVPTRTHVVLMSIEALEAYCQKYDLEVPKVEIINRLGC